MSLLTLESTDNAQNPSSTDPAIIRNNFKDGVDLRKGTEVGLVSLSINKIASFEIIQGVNDTFTWRIGGRTQFNQHRVTVPAGEYTGDSLAEQIKIKLNQSTVLGNYKGAWTVVFDPTKFEQDGSFTIDYGQNATPDFNEIGFDLYNGQPNLTIENSGTREVIVKGAPEKNDIIERTNAFNILTGDRGIFPNDGEAVYRIKPVKGYPLASWKQRFITDGIIIQENKNGVVRQLAFTEPAAGSDAETNGWTYVANFDNGDPDEYWKFDDEDEGVFGIGSDATQDATDETNWDINIVTYNENVEFLQNDTAGGRTSTTPQGTGTKYSGDPEGTKLAIPKAGIGYGTTRVGYVRNQLWNGAKDYPANPDARILVTAPDGFDIMFSITDNPALTDINVRLSQMLQNGAISFPNPNWRNQSKDIFSGKTPQTWDTIAGTNPSPTAWTNFDYAEDDIQVKVQLSNITSMKIFILHDKGGDGNWEEQQLLISMSQANNNMTKNIIEDHYPLRPCFTMSNSGRYDRKEVQISGRYDSQLNEPPVNFVFQEGDEMDSSNPDYVNNDELEADPPANAVKLSALFLYGQILEGDLQSNGGTLPDAEVPTPASRLVNNIAELIGFDRFNIYPSGEVSNPTSTQHKPQLTIREPNLLVELVDFNIKGYNGATGDRGKIIASIPAEELSTNSRTGTLNYFSQYPIMIDLNLVHDITTYDLNVIIRRPNGQVADDLIQKTHITLLFKEGEETKQRRLMKEQTELLSSTLSNINQIKTDSVGYGMPKL